MKTTIPINTVDGCAKTVTAHYHKAGGDDFNPGNAGVKHTAILEIEIMEEPKEKFIGVSIHPANRPLEFTGMSMVNPEVSTSLTAHDGLGAPPCAWFETAEPRVVEVGNIREPRGKFKSPNQGRVYSPGGIAPMLCANVSGGGREPKIIQLGNLVPDRPGRFKNPQRGQVFSDDGISPCLCGLDGRDNVPKVMQVGSYPSSACGGNTDQFVAEPIRIRQATRQGYVECPPGGGFDAAYPDSKLRRGRVQDNGDVVGALTASADNHCVYEGAEPCGLYDNQSGEFARKPVEGLARTVKTDGHGAVMLRYRIRKLTPRECFRLMGMDDADIDKIEAHPFKSIVEKKVYFDSKRNEIETLEAELTGLKDKLKSEKHELNASKSDKKALLKKVNETNKRLREVKRELSGIRRQTIPKSQKYKLAGNSIVVDVLYHLFKAMFIDEPQPGKDSIGYQYSIFDYI